MDAFDQLIVTDLDDRCRRFQERLDVARTDPDLKLHANIAYNELGAVRREIALLLASPGLNDPALNPQHSAMLARLGDRVFVTEAIVGPAIDDFDLHDRRLTRLTKRLADEIGWPMQAPLVVATSDSGFMTFMRLFLMKLPMMEDEKLLAYPDIVHEMGHILSTRHRRQLLGDFPRKLQEYFDRENARTDAPPLPEFVTENWPNWLEEYMCDMVAVYVFGEAFALQHRRLTSLMPARSFTHADSHPADESRLRGAAWVLRKMGADASADKVTALWADRMKNTRERKPKTYERTCPDELLEVLAERVIKGCKQLGIKGFDTPAVSGGVVEGINEVWKAGQTNPATFPAVERAVLERLWADVGLGKAPAPQTLTVLPGGNADALQLPKLLTTSTRPRPELADAARAPQAARSLLRHLPLPPAVTALGAFAKAAGSRRTHAHVRVQSPTPWFTGLFTGGSPQPSAPVAAARPGYELAL